MDKNEQRKKILAMDFCSGMCSECRFSRSNPSF
jgi:hypothetical protein